MIENIIKENLNKYSDKIEKISEEKVIDCITFFSLNENDYNTLNKELTKFGFIVDEMNSGNLFYLKNEIVTEYGNLNFIKVRKPDSNYNRYRISVDFYVNDYNLFKINHNDYIVKKYDTFELVQYKDESYIINIINLRAFDEYKDKI